MKKALFIDRDGTLIVEPPVDRQVDSLEKLRFVPGAISGLRALSGLDFELVLATNQDGLGTPSFPEATFRPAHERMLATLEGEGVRFDDQLIDRTFEADDAPTRKPRTGCSAAISTEATTSRPVTSSATGRPTCCWHAISGRGASCSPPTRRRAAVRCAKPAPKRPARWSPRRGNGSPSSSAAANAASTLTRRTAETQITLTLDLDGRSGAGRIATGIGFFDHMLAQIAHTRRRLTLGRSDRRPVGRRAPHRRGCRHRARRGGRPCAGAARRESPAMASSCPWTTAVPWRSSTSGAASASNGMPNSAANASVNCPPRCCVTSFIRSPAPRAATSTSPPAETTSTTRPKRSSRPSHGRCAWPWARIPFAYDIPSSKGVL